MIFRFIPDPLKHLCPCLLVGSVVSAAPVDFNTFTPYQYNNPTGFAQSATWIVDTGDSSTVHQSSSQNATAAIYLSPDIGVGSRFTGRIVNSGPDDDYLGFVLGFSANEHLDGNADYLLLDWRSLSQNNNFNGAGVGGAEVHNATSPSGSNDIGLALSRVTGRPTADEFWHHYDDPAAMTDAGAVVELVRRTTYGSTGYGLTAGSAHDIRIDWLSDQVDVYVNGLLELSYSGPFVPTTGQLGLYQMFQEGVDFEAFEYVVIPEPAPVILITLIGCAFALLRWRHHPLHALIQSPAPVRRGAFRRISSRKR